MTIGEVQNSSTSISLLNTWRPYEEERQDDEDDIDWTLSQKRPPKNVGLEENIADTHQNSIDPASPHNNTQQLQGHESGEHSVPSISIQGHLA